MFSEGGQRCIGKKWVNQILVIHISQTWTRHRSVTCDGTARNLNFLKNLGRDFSHDYYKIVTKFELNLNNALSGLCNLWFMTVKRQNYPEMP